MKPKELIKGMVYYDTVSGWFCTFMDTDGPYFSFKVEFSGSSSFSKGEPLLYGSSNLRDLVISNKLSKLIYGVECA